MSRKIILLTVVFVLLFLSMSLFTFPFDTKVIASTTHHVYPGQSIQEVINSAQSGDTVFVYIGTYYEHLVVNKTVLLIGEDEHDTIIDGNYTGTVVNVTVSNVRISGFTIRNSGKAENETEWSYCGIYVGRWNTRNNISHNMITNNYDGICLYTSNGNIICENNIVENEMAGIWTLESSNNTVYGNSIINNWVGGAVRVSANISISGNTIANNFDGVSLKVSNSSNISCNIITNNTGGILLEMDSSDNTISMNNITSNGYGIILGTMGLGICSNNTIKENNIRNNYYSGVPLEEAITNRFDNNHFINNTEQVQIRHSGYTNSWNSSYPSGGNYWSDFKERYPEVGDDYKGPNQDEPGSDDIWDKPYKIDDNNIDYYAIVPEFPSFLILPLFMIATLLAVIIYKRKHQTRNKKREL